MAIYLNTQWEKELFCFIVIVISIGTIIYEHKFKK